MKSLLVTLLSLTAALSAEYTLKDQEHAKELMLRDIDHIRNTFEIKYAPSDWKFAHCGWELAKQAEKAKREIEDSPQVSTKDYHAIIKRLLGSTSDYHVNVHFYSTEFADLPFTVVKADNRYYIYTIDRDKLPERLYPIQVGDELIAFDGMPTENAVEELIQSSGTLVVSETSHAIGEMNLTSRVGMNGDKVPNKPVVITIKSSSTGIQRNYQLMWDYFPELVKDHLDYTKPVNRGEVKNPLALLKKRLMLHPQYAQIKQLASKKTEASYRDLGSREGFLPWMGEVHWVTDEQSPFLAYIFKHTNGKTYGYLRIPDYMGNHVEVQAFKEIIAYLEDHSEALILDQLNNPGGSVFYLYTLASYLTKTPLTTPRHRITITPENIWEAVHAEMLLMQIHNDAEAVQILGESFEGYPTSYQLVKFLISYFRFIQNEWNHGRSFTKPYFLYGVDHIHPAPDKVYTKPILMLVNELCFSGGDFLPAILQDNGLVTLFGATTAGAGGYVDHFSYPNQFGVSYVTYTASIAERADLKPIENLGVEPDILYKPTLNDIREGFKEYKHAVLDALEKL